MNVPDPHARPGPGWTPQQPPGAPEDPEELNRPSRRIPHYFRVVILAGAAVGFNVSWPLLMRTFEGSWRLRPWGYALLAVGPAAVFLAMAQIPQGSGLQRFKAPAIFATVIGGGAAAVGLLVEWSLFR